ncbi:MAG: ATP-dependent Clp protease adaptor ClpS [Planctomycetaceae bacterium]|nr:ATP-dependent Clp protease adaptor ClpS [Planctomycetaceae bacterium]
MSDTTPPTPAVAEPPPASKPVPKRPEPKNLPPYKVLLHNDDVTPMDHVVRALRQLAALTASHANAVMMTAHTRGVALVLVTHKERAELYAEQFRSKGLVATIEPA